MADEARGDKRPNVLLIVADHWAAGHLGVAGNDAILTPGLDEMAQCGRRFTNAYSECPVCIPARRTLMTGMTPRSHGDRVFDDQLRMPDVTTMAQAFRDAGYQADAVGKLHVHPQRDRIGFDNVILDDEGRSQWGVLDDYDIYLGDAGYPGRQFDHGMSNNEYSYRAWHLPEETHPTNWAGRMMARTIKRRDPTRPAFWYLGFRHPHPPLVPPQSYLDLYRDIEMDEPVQGAWADDVDHLPYPLKALVGRTNLYTREQMQAAKKAFYALCTQIDHQIRYLVGTLRMEGLLDNTVICFTSDHGDMLGDHGMAAKRAYYEGSANIPMILMGVAGCERVGAGVVDDRLVAFRDVMPTLLGLCDVPVPETVEGTSMVGEELHPYIYGECGEDGHASRMVRKGGFKLIYYPVGNRFQLFNLDADRDELTDLSSDPEHAGTLDEMCALLVGELHGCDAAWFEDGKLGGKLIGLPDREYRWAPHRSLNSQRGDGWPPSPPADIPQVEWAKEKDAD